MSERKDDYVLRKEELRKDGKIEIPMSIDPARYFIGNIRWKDVLFTTPFIVISVLLLIFLTKSGNLNSSTLLFSFLPPILALTFFWVKHPDRKNISFITTVIWQIRYRFSKQMYEYSKEVRENVSEDIRTQLGVFSVANDCMETIDNRFVKIIEVSSINVSGLSEKDRDKVYSNYQSFLNNYPQSAFPLQINQFSKPINLTNYLNWVKEIVAQEENQYKRMFTQSYEDKVNEIQKSKNMVSKARYIIIDEKIGSNRERSLEKINRDAELLVSTIENMLTGRNQLKSHSLDNEELFQNLYASIDYENAQISQSINREYNVDLPFTTSKSSYEKDLEDNPDIEKKLFNL